jgi:hypothetical protein
MFVQEIKVAYLPDVIVHMRVGGHSNSSWRSRIAAHKEDYKAWQLNGISPKWYTVPMKPLRKVEQYRYSLLPALPMKSLSHHSAWQACYIPHLFLTKGLSFLMRFCLLVLQA